MPITQSRIKEIIDSAESIAQTYREMVATIRIACESLLHGDVTSREFFDAIALLVPESEKNIAIAYSVIKAELIHYSLTHKRNEAMLRYKRRKRQGLVAPAWNRQPTSQFPSRNDQIEQSHTSTLSRETTAAGRIDPADAANAAMFDMVQRVPNPAALKEAEGRAFREKVMQDTKDAGLV